MDSAKLEKIEKQIDLLSLKVDIIYDKLAHDERMLDQKSDHRIEDDLIDEAKVVIVKAGKASAGLLQGKLLIGYDKAAKLLDLWEADGVIGPAYGAKPREVLIKK